MTLLYAALYLAFISFAAVLLTLRDKSAARCGEWRVRERTLLLVAALGGSVAMYAAMRAVRHKTRRAKFMAGIPVIFVLQIAAAILIWWKAGGGI